MCLDHIKKDIGSIKFDEVRIGEDMFVKTNSTKLVDSGFSGQVSLVKVR